MNQSFYPNDTHVHAHGSRPAMALPQPTSTNVSTVSIRNQFSKHVDLV